jgi:hypothetical protein
MGKDCDEFLFFVLDWRQETAAVDYSQDEHQVFLSHVAVNDSVLTYNNFSIALNRELRKRAAD